MDWDPASVLPGAGSGPTGPVAVTGTAVAIGERGLLAIGPPGAGKSVLALAMMAHGARLIGDDCVNLVVASGGIHLHSLPDRPPLIEARYVGLLNATPASAARLGLVVDLGTPETERLPPHRTVTCLGHGIALIRGGPISKLAPALIQLLRHGRAH